MTIYTSISRLSSYYKRHGLVATLSRFWLAARRALFSSRMLLFYCDLSSQKCSVAGLPDSLKVERKRGETELGSQDLQELTDFWNPKLAGRRIKQRFELGASLWLIKSEGRLAGFGWTLQGHSVEPYYFLLGADDVHLFDFHVFPEYRGRGLNPLLVGELLLRLAAECTGRAFIEAAEWNQTQLASLSKTPFRYLGSARKLTLLRRTLVSWDPIKFVEDRQKDRVGSTRDVPANTEETRVDSVRARAR